MGKINDSRLLQVNDLYYNKKLSMADVAKELKVSIDAVIYFMRKHKLSRRTFSEVNSIVFERKPMSFKIKENLSPTAVKIKIAGAMLYWAEGYKSSLAHGVDFANSDHIMVKVFMKFLRSTYKLDEKRFRVLLYCYSNQDSSYLINFWSKVTKIPATQFTKPYIRNDFKKDGRKMTNGMIHVRYSDKKLLKVLLELIEEYKKKFAPIV